MGAPFDAIVVIIADARFCRVALPTGPCLFCRVRACGEGDASDSLTTTFLHSFHLTDVGPCCQVSDGHATGIACGRCPSTREHGSEARLRRSRRSRVQPSSLRKSKDALLVQSSQDTLPLSGPGGQVFARSCHFEMFLDRTSHLHETSTTLPRFYFKDEEALCIVKDSGMDRARKPLPGSGLLCRQAEPSLNK